MWWGWKWKVRQRAHREELGEAGGRLAMGTTAVRVAGTRRYHAGASEGLTRGERRKLAKAKKKAAR